MYDTHIHIGIHIHTFTNSQMANKGYFFKVNLKSLIHIWSTLKTIDNACELWLIHPYTI